MRNTQTTPQNKRFSSLEYSTVFQVKVLAISEVAKDLLLEKMLYQSIVVLLRNQAAIKALLSALQHQLQRSTTLET